MNNWYGQYPSHWKLERLQNYLAEINESNNPIKSDNVLSLTNKLGVVPYNEKGNQGNVAKENLEGYKLAYPNTIVCNCMNVLIGSVGISKYFGCVSPVYYVYKAKENADLDFINYVFQTTPFQKELRRYANGILEIRLRVSSSNILKREIPIPSKEEQIKIVKVIKSKEEKINSLITNEEKQIEKLKAYKQVLISEVVTKGLDPNVPMKDSGVEWIGEIPVDWSCHRFKFIINSLRKGSGITKDLVNLFGDIQCIRYGEIYSKYDEYVTSTFSKTFLDNIEAPQFIKKGELLFACTGELVEEIGKNIAYMGDEPCLAGGDIIIANHSQNPRFLNYALNSQYSQKQKSYGKAKLKVVHIYSRDIANLKIAIPNLEVQKSIADYLDNLCLNINDLINNKLSKIDYLKQYRQSIIYEYVTGKREV